MGTGPGIVKSVIEVVIAPVVIKMGSAGGGGSEGGGVGGGVEGFTAGVEGHDPPPGGTTAPREVVSPRPDAKRPQTINRIVKRLGFIFIVSPDF